MSAVPPRYVRLVRPPGEAWNTGYRCIVGDCGYETGFWPDDGSAEENIHTHLSNAHGKEN